jgi:cytochrome b involved in lipid metabolism
MPAPAPTPEASIRSKYAEDSAPLDTTHNSKPMKASNTRSNASHIQDKYEGERYVTRIHGKYYDLTSFKHPGGPLAIASIQGRDGTELFESHHLFTDINVKQILEKYEMPTAPAEEITINDVYDWEATLKDPFTIELKNIARKQLGKDIKINWYRTIESTVLFLIALSQIIKFA